MKKGHRNNKIRENNIKKARIIILFIVIVLFIVGGSALVSLKFSGSRQEVQAIDINQNADSKSSDKKDVTDDVTFVEKYLDQQMKGQKPDGADGISL